MESNTGQIMGRFCMLLLTFLTLLQAQAQRLKGDRDAIITKFSGINPYNTVAVIKSIGDPLGSGAPFGTNWITPNLVTPAITSWTKDSLGEIFGVEIAQSGAVFFSATAGWYYNSSTVKPYPSMGRLAGANPIAAPIGSYGFRAIGTAGNAGMIYSANATALNSVQCLVTAENLGAPSVPGVSSGLGTNKIPNTGFGIGNLAVADRYNRLFFTNLEDGKIYSISSTAGTGVILDVFDPFSPDNGAAGIAPYGDRLFAIAVNEEFTGNVRVYYSVLKNVSSAGSQNEIWSVGLDATGKMIPADNTLEVVVPINTDLFYEGTLVTDIEFSVRGEMAISEKGNPHAAHAYLYFGRHNAWSTPETLWVSNHSIKASSNGGIDFGALKTQQNIHCDSLIWITENCFNGISCDWYGINSNPLGGFAGAASTIMSQTYVVDIDNVVGQNDNPKGRFGDVEFFDSVCTSKPTDVCQALELLVQKDVGCCYTISVRNNFHAQYFTEVALTTSRLNIDNVTAGPYWGGVSYKDPHQVKFGDSAKLWYLPADTTFVLATVCLSGNDNDSFTFYFKGNAPQFDTVCVKSIPIEPCQKPVDTSCVSLVNPTVRCEGGNYKMDFQLKNNGTFTMRAVTFYPQNPNVSTVPTFYPIADLPVGQTSPVYTISLNVLNHDTAGCFFVAACDLHVFPGTSGQYPKFCCMDSISYCVKIPDCSPCDAINVTATKSDPDKCCYSLKLQTNWTGSNISCIRFKGIGGTQFALLSGWNMQYPASSNSITICAPGAGIGSGIYNHFADFCLTGTSSAPRLIALEFLDSSGKVLCVKNLEFDNCQLATPTCANIVNDSIYCDGKHTRFTFSIANNSPFAIYHIDLRPSDTSFHLDTSVIIPTTAIPVGSTAGPYTINITRTDSSVQNFCMYLSAHNGLYTGQPPFPSTCCTDSLGVICVPFLSCDSASCCTNCCTFAGLTIPNGITPNGDGYNDLWVLTSTNVCKKIEMVVYNRWGNVVYEDDNYLNNWGGTNQSGNLLPQGTYYVVIKLPDGQQRALYLDIRY